MAGARQVPPPPRGGGCSSLPSINRARLCVEDFRVWGTAVQVRNAAIQRRRMREASMFANILLQSARPHGRMMTLVVLVHVVHRVYKYINAKRSLRATPKRWPSNKNKNTHTKDYGLQHSERSARTKESWRGPVPEKRFFCSISLSFHQPCLPAFKAPFAFALCCRRAAAAPVCVDKHSFISQ